MGELYDEVEKKSLVNHTIDAKHASKNASPHAESLKPRGGWATTAKDLIRFYACKQQLRLSWVQTHWNFKQAEKIQVIFFFFYVSSVSESVWMVASDYYF